jgi:sulfide:quinone oxidoreductase
VISEGTPSATLFAVVIAGGGVAAAEAAVALRDLAGDRVNIKLVAPNDDLFYRPMTVGEPFGHAKAPSIPLERIAAEHGIDLLKDSFAWVDRKTRTAHMQSGDELPYDALTLCLGATTRARFQHAITIDDRALDEQLHGLVQDVEGGYVKSLAFIVPGRRAWPLPIYELALMTAARAADMNIELAITLLTTEQTPLEVFGAGVSQGVSALLDDAGISRIHAADCDVARGGQILIAPTGSAWAREHSLVDRGPHELQVDRVVAAPELVGPYVRGIPGGVNGFIGVDPHCQVRGVQRIYAAGDATDFAVKFGGAAAQQADTAARAIASLAGAHVTPTPFHPVIRGVLMTGDKVRYLSARVTGGHGFNSQITQEPTWSPVNKIDALYLAPYLTPVLR